eukprot:TRINITY_DN3114_c0_g1_i1.p1 TRINITY_DN3114_c0_g1~~TRINITY_DN3114_c0_g1_i1.p1  ORF type:complete len:437 (+),score=85.60 TRINITY_DN3114_c0_g1_i1:195-1505(+)
MTSVVVPVLPQKPLRADLIHVPIVVPVIPEARKVQHFDATAVVRNGRSPPEMVRPCKHNCWDDVRTRRHAKILQCRACLSKWKLPMPVPRCSYFLHGHCEKGETCHMLHVYKKKADKEKLPAVLHESPVPIKQYIPQQQPIYSRDAYAAVDELKAELMNRRRDKKMADTNPPPYAMFQYDMQPQPSRHVVAYMGQIPSPASSEPPPLMSPAPPTPTTPAAMPGGVVPPSPLGDSGMPRPMGLAARRGFANTLASSAQAAYYGGLGSPPVGTPGPGTCESEARKESMPSLVATPMGGEPPSPYNTMNTMYETITYHHQPCAQVVQPEDFDSQEKARMMAMAAGYAMSSGAIPTISLTPSAASPACSPHHTLSPVNITSPPHALCVSPTSPGSSAGVPSPVAKENEGVHAMSEEELDEHIKNWERTHTPMAHTPMARD